MSLLVSSTDGWLESRLSLGAFARRSHPIDPFEALRAPEAAVLGHPGAAEADKASGPSCWTFGDLVLTRTFCGSAPAIRLQQRGTPQPDHWRLELTRSRCGQRTRLTLGKRHRDTDFSRARASMLDESTRDAAVLTLFLPSDFRSEGSGVARSAGGLAINPQLSDLLAGYIDNLARQLPHIPPEHAHGLAAATRSFVAACVVPSADEQDGASASAASLLVDRARLVVRENMGCPGFGPEQLSRLMAMSRSKLYRLFESTGGVAHFINRERLREAHRRLDAPGDGLSIHVIGNQVGFSDHSTFSRAFRREFGYSPTDARERGLARLAPRHAATSVRDSAGTADHAPSLRCATRSPSRKFGMTSAELGF